MNEREKMIKKLLFLCVTFGSLLGACLTAIAADGTKIDHRDMHLSPEALSAAEGMPYDYLLPEEKVVKTRIDPRDVYLSPEALSAAEGLPYEYQMDKDAYVPVKYSPRDRDLDVERMVSDDPSFIKGQENY